MENSLLEILTYYVIGGALLIGAPGVFFFIVFQPALQNTKGRMVGYKDHKTYGDSSIYENTPSDNTKFFLELGVDNDCNIIYNDQHCLLCFVGIFRRTTF